jgi:predicted PurR-regulated permease PerM
MARQTEREAFVEAPDVGAIVDSDSIWRRLNTAAGLGSFAILLGFVAYLARPILLPVAAAIIVGSTIGPAADRAHQRGVPPVLAALVIVAVFLVGLYLLIVEMSAPVSGWVGRAPELQAIFKEKLSVLERPLNALRELNAATNDLRSMGPSASVSVDMNPGSLIGSALSVLTPALTEFVIFFGSLLLFLAGRKEIKKKLTLSFLSRDARLATLRIIADVEESLTTYLFTVSAINVGLGLCTGVVMWAIGVPNAAILGVTATILNYVPYIGPVTMTVVLFLVSLVSFPSLSYALLAPCLFAAIAFIEGQFVTPAVLGHRLTVNPFLVFLAIAFWAWLWGPLGAILAVPILLIFTIIGRHLFPGDGIELPG